MKIRIGNPSTFHYPLLLYCNIYSLFTIALLTFSLPSPSSLLKLPIVSIPLFAYTDSWYTIGQLWQLTTTLSQPFGFARARLTNMSSMWKPPTSHLWRERGRSGRIEVFEKMLTGSALLSSRHYSLVRYFTARSLLRSSALTEAWQWLCHSRYWAPVTFVCPVTHSFNLTFSNSERRYKNANLNVKNRIICVLITPLSRLRNKFCFFIALKNASPCPYKSSERLQWFLFGRLRICSGFIPKC